jgi:cytochrome d ubiquinol oxidase subunit II
MHLSDFWMIFVVLAFVAYIVLDGYDLGIGLLTLMENDDGRRRDMYTLVARAWDANESWLILLALTLWGGLPLAYGIVLPALYIPLFLMLFSIIWRGVAIEMLAQYGSWHRRWGLAFGLGSLVAGFCQGASFGGLLAGVSTRGSIFAGGPVSFFHDGYAVLSGLTTLVLYTLAGAAWVYANSEGALRLRVARFGRAAAALLAPATAACWILLPAVGPTILRTAGSRLPVWIAGAVILGAGLTYVFQSFGKRLDAGPVYGTLTVYVGGLMLLLGLNYPYVLPPHITVHQAASPNSTLIFLIVGVGACLPVIFAYQSFAYWTFRGKLRGRDEGEALAR